MKIHYLAQYILYSSALKQRDAKENIHSIYDLLYEMQEAEKTETYKLVHC